ncbi:hypothetical protein BHYA_0024g00060 [Botrytis hyacinthi]|uniref:Uncharacterized protein n=1 Tax=Botrytis hyacinthi TaxID=278943 RepID=A0A4Z1H219_9HELO|nr:hypothetical protein BHYA_0024g00060 [Botrytis hyacinthi]
MLKRPAAAGMSSSMGPAKKQRLTKSIVKGYMFLSKDDLICKKNHLEVVQLLIDLRGAYQQLQVEYRDIEEELCDVDFETREYAEVIQKKISIHDFKEIVGSCFVKIRHDSLELVGKDVFLRWDAGANSFTVSGKYGVTAIACLE